MSDVERLTRRKRELREVFRGERCAIADTRDVGFGMVRLTSAKVEADGIETRAFRALDQARAWLGADPGSGGPA